jgi:hypothetical protein
MEGGVSAILCSSIIGIKYFKILMCRFIMLGLFGRAYRALSGPAGFHDRLLTLRQGGIGKSTANSRTELGHPGFSKEVKRANFSGVGLQDRQLILYRGVCILDT